MTVYIVIEKASNTIVGDEFFMTEDDANKDIEQNTCSTNKPDNYKVVELSLADSYYPEPEHGE